MKAKNDRNKGPQSLAKVIGANKLMSSTHNSCMDIGIKCAVDIICKVYFHTKGGKKTYKRLYYGKACMFFEFGVCGSQTGQGDCISDI